MNEVWESSGNSLFSPPRQWRSVSQPLRWECVQPAPTCASLGMAPKCETSETQLLFTLSNQWELSLLWFRHSSLTCRCRNRCRNPVKSIQTSFAPVAVLPHSEWVQGRQRAVGCPHSQGTGMPERCLQACAAPITPFPDSLLSFCVFQRGSQLRGSTSSHKQGYFLWL